MLIQVTATVSKVMGDGIDSCNKADSHSKAKPRAVIKAPEEFCGREMENLFESVSKIFVELD